MMPLLVAALGSLCAVGFVLWRLSSHRVRAHPSPSVQEPRLSDLVRRYGKNSNSFLTLYPGFRYFRASEETGVVAYVDSWNAWVGATEPLCESANTTALLEQFSVAAEKNRKSALILPVPERVAIEAKEVGYGRLMIGCEPTFCFDRYQPSLDLVPAAKSLFQKGARVEGFDPDHLSRKEKRRCDEITEEWLSTRRIDPLSFLNQVAPWELSQEKRYFLVRYEGRIEAFLAAIPIWPRRGWYFNDLLRHSQAEIGTTEILVLEAMRLLKESGAQEVTLGVAPLSHLEAAERSEHPWFYRILTFMFHHTNQFYRFKPLFDFKMKFRPTKLEKSYLIYSPPRPGLLETLSLLEAFFPGGIIRASWSGVRRLFWRWRLEDLFQLIASDKLCARRLPAGGFDLLSRSVVSIGWGVAWILLDGFRLLPILPFLSLLPVALLTEFLGGPFLLLLSGLGPFLTAWLSGVPLHPLLAALAGILGALCPFLRGRSAWVLWLVVFSTSALTNAAPLTLLLWPLFSLWGVLLTLVATGELSRDNLRRRAWSLLGQAKRKSSRS